jgi:uncharacterized membrane protein
MCRTRTFSLGCEKNAAKRDFMMNDAYGWMGGGMWVWTVICILAVVLLVVMINKVSTK